MTENTAKPPTAPVWLQRAVAILVFSALAFGLIVPKLAGAAYLLLGLSGATWLTLSGRWRPGDLIPIERLLFMAVVLYILVWILGWLIHGLDPAGADAVSQIARLLLIIPILLMIRQLDGIEPAFWRGLTVGALTAGGYAWWSYLSGHIGPHGERVVGTTSPLYFGGLSLAFALMLLPRLRDASLPWIVRLLAVLASVSAISASALSGSRGAWLVLPLLLLIYLFTLGRRQPPFWRFGIPATFLAIALLFLLNPISPMNERALSGVDDISALISGDDLQGTLGRRIELWSIAAETLGENSLLGVGPGIYPQQVQQAVVDGRLPEDFVDYEHPHSEYLSALLHVGPLGLVALLLLFGIALRRYGRVWQTGLRRTRHLGWAGLAGLSTLVIMALTESLFERNIGVVWFGLLAALSAGLIHARRRQDLKATNRRVHSLSVIIICKNQAGEIDRCLSSVHGWADEIIVLDSGSTDDTVARCRRYTDQVFETDWPGFGQQKQRALDRATCDWVLSLDADEALSIPLKHEIDLVLSQPDPEFSGFHLRWLTFAFGYQLSFGHWARAPLRLFKRDQARFTPAKVHEKVILADAAEVGILDGALEHYVYRDLAHAQTKLRRYAELQASQRYKKGRRVRTRLAPVLRAIVNWLDNMLLRLAIIDGRGGWTMSKLNARYTYDKYEHLRQMTRSD